MRARRRQKPRQIRQRCRGSVKRATGKSLCDDTGYVEKKRQRESMIITFDAKGSEANMMPQSVEKLLTDFGKFMDDSEEMVTVQGKKRNPTRRGPQTCNAATSAQWRSSTKRAWIS